MEEAEALPYRLLTLDYFYGSPTSYLAWTTCYEILLYHSLSVIDKPRQDFKSLLEKLLGKETVKVIFRSMEHSVSFIIGIRKQTQAVTENLFVR